MKSLQESLIFELNSSTYASAHDKEVARNGKETNRSRRFAVAAGKALTAELKKKGLIDLKTGKLKDNKRTEALPVIAVVQSKPDVQNALKNDENSISNLRKKSGKNITIDIPAYIMIRGFKCNYHKGFTIKFPNAKYVIYNDKYHNRLHIATLTDMIDSIGNAIYDYEGFGPEDIVYKSEDPIDVVKYAVEHYGTLDKTGKVKKTGTYDHPEWAQGVLDGTDDFDYRDGMGIIDVMSNYIGAFVDDEGYVYNAWRSGGLKPHTEKYQDYMKRVDAELSESIHELEQKIKQKN